VDGNAIACSAVDANTVFVLAASQGTLWCEHAPFGSVPPVREHVDDNVIACSAVDANTVYVLGNDHSLWLEHAPFGSVPPTRELVDSGVADVAPTPITQPQPID
jgi:hypothetical protein